MSIREITGNMFNPQPVQESDHDDIWSLLKPVFQTGETYAFGRGISRDDALQAWITAPQKTFVVRDSDNGRLFGSYFLKANQPGPGSHVCNCGYVVSEAARGRGIASDMCNHSQNIARELGYRAMQYNLVVSTNGGAMRLWQKHGFEIVGTLPGAFCHPEQGYVDAHVMFKSLVD